MSVWFVLIFDIVLELKKLLDRKKKVARKRTSCPNRKVAQKLLSILWAALTQASF